MLEFIKKRWQVLLAIIAVVSIGVNIYSYTDSRISKDLNRILKQANGYLDSQIKEAKEKQNSYLKEIKEKNKTIAAMDKKLSESVRNNQQLKAEITNLRKPENPRNFKDLKECKRKYAELTKDYELSLAYGKETEISLTLCLEKSKEQQDVIILTENAYMECQKQLKLNDSKIENFRASFKERDRFYKRNRPKRSLLQFIAGAVIGGIATYLILKRK